MKVIQLLKQAYCLPFKNAWQTSKGRLTHRYGFILKIKTADGLIGIGDCAPFTEMGTETLKQAYRQYTLLQNEMESIQLSSESIAAFSEKLNPALAMAMETAIYDILAQRENVPLSQYLNRGASSGCQVNANIGILDGQIKERAILAIQQGYSCLKIKTSVFSLANEINHLDTLFRHFSHAKIKWRFDANQGWSYQQAENFIAFLKSYSNIVVDYLEEPIHYPQLERIAQLQELTNFPIALDESLVEFGIDTILHSGIIKHIVLKAGLVGGITHLLKVKQACQDVGVNITLTSLLESAIGIQANLHLACAINNNVSHGLATSNQLKYDLAAPADIDNGYMFLNNLPGLGISI